MKHLILGSFLLGLGLCAQAQKSKTDLQVENIEEPRAVYNFNPLKSEDPFKTPIGAVVSEIEKKTERYTFLQDYPASQIKILGVLGKKGKRRKAVLMAPNKRTKSVQVGHPIGDNNGFVVAILEDGIRVKEFTFLSDGSKKSKVFEMHMMDKKSEQEAKNAAAPPPEPSSDVFRKVYDQLRKQGKSIDEISTQLEEVKK